MDAVILCGGKGTRLSEETILKPKPMVEIGGLPILWHIMKMYSYYGVKRFILALGYKGEFIKQYFYNYKITKNDFILKLDPNHSTTYLSNSAENEWEIVFVNTGEETLKGGRIKKVENFVKGNSFHLTYGDGIADLDLNKLKSFHNLHNSLGTVTAVRPPSRFGELTISNENLVESLEEKPQMGQGLINGGFFIFDRRIFNYLADDEKCDFEFGPLQKITQEKNLRAYIHDGFWQCMDNVRERDFLSGLVKDGKAPWIKW